MARRKSKTTSKKPQTKTEKAAENTMTADERKKKLMEYVNLRYSDIKQGTTFEGASELLGLAQLSMQEGMSNHYCFALSNKAKVMCYALIYQKDFNSIDGKYDCVPDLLKFDEYCRLEKITTQELELIWRIFLWEAQNMKLDSYLVYVEKNREISEKFYMPRRRCFIKIGLVQALQDILEDKLDILSISLPPGTGKSTMEKFFHSAVMGWFPQEYNLFFSHSSDITRMYYDGVLSILTDELYAWNEIFPDLEVTSTNAKLMQINIGDYKPFQNLQTASVGSEMSGKVRASKFLLVDDMIGKIEEALNKNTLDKLWNVYTVDARQRKVTGCKEIHIATRWSVHDIIGRLQRSYEDSDRVRFIAVPDVDPKTGESNFDFDYNGFTVEFFEDQAKTMDDITYRCLYKNEPIEREGLLYHEEDIRRYSTLPDREPDAIVGVCDTKSKGTDFMVLPVLYQYDNDYYLVDAICDDSSDFDLQYGQISNMILNHDMQQCEFESNAGGDRIAHEVAQRVKQGGGRCNITTKATETNKETRIIVNSDWVKKNILFKDKDSYSNKSQYGVFMTWLLSYSVAGKNAHDDVVDALANFVLFVTRKARRVQGTRIIRSPI